MEYAVSITDMSYAEEIERNGLLLLEKLNHFSLSLEAITTFGSPRGIIFHDLKSATELYSTIPLPAYTSRDLIHINPLIDTWKDIFLSTTRGLIKAEQYYKHLSIDDIAVIAAHELTHHADFFHSEFEDWDEEENMWFEEGMCFYIPRKMILSTDKFNEIMEVERSLIELYKPEYGEYTIDLFGDSGYRGGNGLGYSSAFYDYWRSTNIVNLLIEKYCNGDMNKLIESYKNWVNNSAERNLQKFFIDDFQLSKHEAKALWLDV
ncbi:hypothetical protein SAMN05216353_11669 [Halobacillus alkaliphilus]|uniref:Uncharacterized protein n=1 Tax=Halobacillus alkaliphilus TaxID=396056 RepID=A0A1I2N736_9BACI|nr:hypothetical protein [Halobacillus alkaliphilus]SFF97316.1 hypothetical protein SAMN05216353_11669 [Halobacillus alkaliphilus]